MEFYLHCTQLTICLPSLVAAFMHYVLATWPKPLRSLKSLRVLQKAELCPADVSACLWWAHGFGVIWKPFLLVHSPSSHFNLSVEAHTSSPIPRTPGKPEFSGRAPRTPSRHGTQAHPRSAPLARKNHTGSETNIPVLLYIIHGSCPGCHTESKSITVRRKMFF